MSFVDRKLATVTSNLYYQLKAPEEVLMSSLGCRGHNMQKTFLSPGSTEGLTGFTFQ